MFQGATFVGHPCLLLFSRIFRSLLVRSCFEPQVEEETRATLARKKSSAALGESHAEERLVPLGLVQLTIKAIDFALQEIERHVGEVEDGKEGKGTTETKESEMNGKESLATKESKEDYKGKAKSKGSTATKGARNGSKKDDKDKKKMKSSGSKATTRAGKASRASKKSKRATKEKGKQSAATMKRPSAKKTEKQAEAGANGNENDDDKMLKKKLHSVLCL